MTAGPLLLGVRHHGPGSARAVRAALDAAAPAAVLIEGPPEADALLPLAADPRMRPPVALLAHTADDPGRAAFWPMAEFSPEWVALRWALERGAAVRFFDLPAAHSLAMAQDPSWTDGDAEGGDGGGGDSGGGGHGDDPEAAADRARRAGLRRDPLAALAEAGGYEDAERWWEDVVEHRAAAGPGANGPPDTAPRDPLAVFARLAEAMAALRQDASREEEPGTAEARREAVREAHMRLRLRAARREYGEEVAVVCGAWHVPALTARTTATADRALLKGLPKVRTETTWVPWTHRRLARHTGYGAGVDSPGWYAHLFAAPDRPVERWLTRVAGLLREEDHAVSPAQVIEAVRLAEMLAALRGRPLAGLAETTDAVRAAMCGGSDVPLRLVEDRLVVGDVMGQVPEGAPAVPLQRDLSRLQRTLRLRPEPDERALDLDLRKETDAARSRLLHRLRLLGVPWGEPVAGRSGTGTFREPWRLRWEPELHIRVAEAGVWGTTVHGAATAKAEARAVAATTLAEVTALAETCLAAGLAEALPVVMRALSDRAALDADVAHLAQALPALARSLRYGDVRGTDTAALAEVAVGLAERIRVLLPPACTGLGADAAAEMRGHLDAVHTAIRLLPDTGGGADAVMDASAGRGLLGRWAETLGRLADRDAVPGVVRGRAARLLFDDGRLDEEEAARLMAQALSAGAPPAAAAAWIEGFAGGGADGAGGGLLLVHDERLLGLVDGWLSTVPPEAFTDVLPLLRRTFSAYEPAVRRSIGELVRRGPAGRRQSSGAALPGAPGFGPGLDGERADAVLPVLRLLLGDPSGQEPGQGPGRPGTDTVGAGR
ncbi:DUF5682 family protein [Streptomyces lichenis]|uniref:DUF5682 family protein n=1 Tax=Streptomyces lichenis TaxID=2306967 RepID=A0ABT0I7C0_9ACTN|nr:DUF5682 family protein [Streptomyces lichenis]MCK8677206.1 DUF5682 family protein [Streptomyces lichenis]